MENENEIKSEKPAKFSSAKRHLIFFLILFALIGGAILRSSIATRLDGFTFDEAYHIGVHIGDRSEQSAKDLWAKVPLEVKVNALVLTDSWKAYGLAIPKQQHVACGKQSGEVSLIERFNCTFRQRVSRLVRKTLSFSKSDWFHQEAIKYFLAHYNLKCQERNFST